MCYPKCDFNLKPTESTGTFKTIESNCEEGLLEILKKIRINNVNKVLIEHINFNSIKNKFDMLSNMVKYNVDILMVSETKLDYFFPQTQFRIEECAYLFRYDRNSHGGGILLFIRQNIPVKLISITPLKDFEGFFVELNFRKKKHFSVLFL